MKRIIPLILLATCNLAAAETPSQIAAANAAVPTSGPPPEPESPKTERTE